MPWTDDSWKDSYDDWKLASPDDDYDDDPREDDCDHEDHETDILTGMASCHRCGHRWMQTPEEIAAEHERIARSQEWEARENRLQWWRDLWSAIRSIFPRRRRAVILDDDIPF